MGTVIKFPRVPESGRIRRRETTARLAGASAEIIILPVIRVERQREVAVEGKAKAAKSVAARSAAKTGAKRGAKTAPASSASESASGPKRHKRVAHALPAPVCGRG